MDYKYRSLLLNVPTRHLLNRMKEGDDNIKEHLKLMDRIDLNNIYLLGKPEKAAQYLSTASSLGFTGKKWSWVVMAKESLDGLQCPNCQDFSMLTLSPSPMGSDR